MRRGHNPRTSNLIRIAAKAEMLRNEYFPRGGWTVMDAERLRLAAKHYVTAETCRDPIVAQRATRVAEFLLSKIKPPPAQRPSAAADQAALALELLLNKASDG